MKLTQHQNGKITLSCTRGDFALLLVDAAKSMTGNCEPIAKDVIRLADEFSEFERVRNPDSGSCGIKEEVCSILKQNSLV